MTTTSLPRVLARVDGRPARVQGLEGVGATLMAIRGDVRADEHARFRRGVERLIALREAFFLRGVTELDYLDLDILRPDAGDLVNYVRDLVDIEVAGEVFPASFLIQRPLRGAKREVAWCEVAHPRERVAGADLAAIVGRGTDDRRRQATAGVAAAATAIVLGTGVAVVARGARASGSRLATVGCASGRDPLDARLGGTIAAGGVDAVAVGSGDRVAVGSADRVAVGSGPIAAANAPVADASDERAGDQRRGREPHRTSALPSAPSSS